MPTPSTIAIAALTSVALLAGCASDDTPISPRSSAASLNAFAHSEWSEPQWLGPVVNTPFREIKPALSPDELSLYVGSDRPGGFGGLDIWVSRRACPECPWEPPMNLGPTINTAANDGSPSFSNDGHLLFFVSNRRGGAGDDDIYVSRRANPHDDSGWESPTRLGAEVNTPLLEGSPAYLQSAEGGAGSLYFSRAATVPSGDIYYVAVTRDGATRGPATRVDELSDPTAADFDATVRADGREVIFWSTRPGSGGADLWVSTRRSIHDPWSRPRNLGPPVNSAFAELGPTLSRDGRTLVFSVGQARGGLGLQDIWMSTRRPGGGQE